MGGIAPRICAGRGTLRLYQIKTVAISRRWGTAA
jgi:hypothetical protein